MIIISPEQVSELLSLVRGRHVQRTWHLNGITAREFRFPFRGALQVAFREAEYNSEAYGEPYEAQWANDSGWYVGR
jgi:hypothetical protein